MSDTTVNNFKAFYEQIRPYLGSAHSGFTPVGTVISVMGTTAPMNYLACDGTVYNIADYPELAAHFTAQFGAANYFGGNGTTTFAVPDLRGEFLRGAGTNSHANQGSGANVGVHQNATEIPIIDTVDGYINVHTNPTTQSNEVVNADSNIGTVKRYTWIQGTRAGESSASYSYSSRPTNTSVLYCIASKNIFMDAGMNYSTEEQVVGTWIDSKPIYQKTISFTTPNTSGTTEVIDLSSLNLDYWQLKAGSILSNGSYIPWNCTWSNSDLVLIWIRNNKRLTVRIADDYRNSPAYVTIQYTKTTDA